MTDTSRDYFTIASEYRASSEKLRRQLASTLLSMYAAVVSALCVFVTSDAVRGLSLGRRRLFAVIALSAILIVFSSLLEKLLVYFQEVQAARSYLAFAITPTNNAFWSLGAGRVTSLVVRCLPAILLVLVCVNVISLAAFMYAGIF